MASTKILNIAICKIMNSKIILFSIILAHFTANAKEDPQAFWIGYPTANVTSYGIFHFRKTFEVKYVPSQLKIHVSADNRYNLFVNGDRVSYGPAKGDLKTYKYDIVDIAPYLKVGKNVLAAVVHNAGKDKPMAFISVQTGFYLDTKDENYKSLRTNESWKTIENKAYKPISYQEMIHNDRWFKGYYACGPGDDLDANKYPWGWEQSDFNDNSWVPSEVLTFEDKVPWNLVPRSIAFMDNHIEMPQRIRKAEGMNMPKNFIKNSEKIHVPAESKVKLLLDFGIFTMGYPELTVNGGRGSSMKIKYAEALYEKIDLKAHRDSVEGKIMFGVWDIFRPDGNNERTFRPLWKRSFRYVELLIETGKEPLDILSIQNEYSGYPYTEMSTFKSNDTKLNQVFEIGLRTLRMCSGETYYDTPYYEQLSYGGDNRPITALSTYNSNDDRLLREALRLYPQSKNKETKLFLSAYPSRFDFDMGSWSLAWIQTLKDYYYIRGDVDFVKQFTEDIEGVLAFYQRHLNEEKGILGTVINQNFIDWSITSGSIPRSNDQKEITNSALLTLYYVHTLDCTVSLYEQIGLKDKADKYREESKRIKLAVKSQYWSSPQKMFKDYPNQEVYSQHTNIMAILCDILPLEEQQDLLKTILKADKLDEYASSYFSFFLFKAMEKTGMEDLFLQNLDFWFEFIEKGHTTCGETGFASHDRSDCHAWSAHPSYYLLSIVCGIKPAEIGFNTVKIRPHLGELKNISASMPHLKGLIKVKYKVTKLELSAEITLPKGVSGTFEYKSSSQVLKEGENLLKIKVM